MLLKRIASVEFGVLGPEMIRKMSALEVKTPDTYDKDGYPMESGLMDPHLGVINPGLRCKSCGQQMKFCPGHFGHLTLVRPVVHSEFSKKVDELLQATCRNCGKIALSEEKLAVMKATHPKKEELAKKILFRARKSKRCPHCSSSRGIVLLDKPTNFFYNKERLYPTEIREWVEKIPDQHLEMFGYDLNRLRPEWFVLTVLQVPPITIRPSITLESGIKSEDDLTHKLVDIIRINLRLKDNIEAGAPQLIIEDLWDLLQYHVTTYFDNNTAGVPPAKHRSGRALRTLVQRLKGKKGRFRYNLTGKRVNFAARSTISPDPYISINELGVPEDIAKELTVPEYVTEWNVKKLKKLLKDSKKIVYIVRPNGQRKKITEENKKEVEEELDIGFKVERQLEDGDIVLFNRQPSLHRLSMIAHKAKLMPHKTFRINPIICQPYNADFDGDEMNMHVPQTEEGKTEARELMFAENQIISPRYGAPVIAMQEDGITGSYIFTSSKARFSKEEAMKYCYEIGIEELPEPDIEEKYYSGKILYSLLLPKDLNLEYRTRLCGMLKKIGKCTDCVKEKCKYDAYLKIENGKIVSGSLDSESLGEGRGKLVDLLAREYPSSVIEKFYTLASRIVEDIVTKKGLTVGLDEYEPSKGTVKLRENAFSIATGEGEKLVQSYLNKTLELIPGRTLGESFEIRMMEIGARTKGLVENQILGEKIAEIVDSKFPKYNNSTMIASISGSRGRAANLTNISGFWGQVSVRDGRPKRGFKQRLIALNKKEDVGIIAGGFVKHNFMEGLGPREFFYHAMGGRQGEVDTGVSTKVSGYLYRRLANSLKDLLIDNDETVRTSNKNIIQYLYGEDGVFPMHTRLGVSLDVKAELKKLKFDGA